MDNMAGLAGTPQIKAYPAKKYKLYWCLFLDINLYLPTQTRENININQHRNVGNWKKYFPGS